MKLFSSWVSGAAEIRHFVARPDNVLSNSGKDFYQPDWMHGVEAKAMWLVRISKVAKCIDPAFASRYYENLSVGVSLRAKELDSSLPESMKENFDCSLFRWSEWLTYDEVSRHSMKGVKMLTTDHLEEAHQLMLPERTLIEAVITELSRYYLLKIGDLVAIPAMEQVWEMEREQGLFICNEQNEELVFLRIK